MHGSMRDCEAHTHELSPLQLLLQCRVRIFRLTCTRKSIANNSTNEADPESAVHQLGSR